MNGGKIVLGGHLIQFNRFEEEVELPNQDRTVAKLKTKCMIFDANDNKLADEVISLHHEDRPNKVIGRHNVFKKAMNSLNVNREVKTAIWNDYRVKLKSPAKIQQVEATSEEETV